MAFVTIKPSAGTTPKPPSCVTVSWRTRSAKPEAGHRQRVLAIYIGTTIAAELGWTGKLKMDAAYCADTNRLRLQRCEARRGVGFSAHDRNGTICITVPLRHCDAEDRPAASVPHEVQRNLRETRDSALVLTLPAWSWDPAKKRAVDAKEAAMRRAAGQAERAAA